MLRKIKISHIPSGQKWTSGWIEVDKIEPEKSVESLIALPENVTILVIKSDGGTIGIPSSIWNESVRSIEYKQIT